jgi:hypothetical protein
MGSKRGADRQARAIPGDVLHGYSAGAGSRRAKMGSAGGRAVRSTKWRRGTTDTARKAPKQPRRVLGLMCMEWVSRSLAGATLDDESHDLLCRRRRRPKTFDGHISRSELSDMAADKAASATTHLARTRWRRACLLRMQRSRGRRTPLTFTCNVRNEVAPTGSDAAAAPQPPRGSGCRPQAWFAASSDGCARSPRPARAPRRSPRSGARARVAAGRPARAP